LIERSCIHKITFSDSVTLYQLDLFDFIRRKYSNDKIIYWLLKRSNSGHYKVFGERLRNRINLPFEGEKYSAWYENIREVHYSDLTIIGANAITLNRKIVSVDDLSNRVSIMILDQNMF